MEDTKESYDRKQNPLRCTQMTFSELKESHRTCNRDNGVYKIIHNAVKFLNLANDEITNNWQAQYPNSNRGKFRLKYKQQHLNDNQCTSLSIFMT